MTHVYVSKHQNAQQKRNEQNMENYRKERPKFDYTAIAAEEPMSKLSDILLKVGRTGPLTTSLTRGE
jgi:hypothetical protein